jgi:pyruvate-formate lyase-activating enzyme
MCPKTSRSLDYYHNPVDIDFARLARLLDEHGEYLSLVQLHGGEPLMHRRIADVLDVLNHHRLKFTITTNGHFLTPDTARKLTRNCIRMIVSVDAATPALYSQIRRGGDIDRIRQNIALLNRVKQEVGSPLPYLRTVMAVFSYNIHEMAELVALCHDWGVPSVVFQEGMLYDNPEVGPEHLISNHQDRLYAAVDRVRAMSRQLGTSVRFDFDFWDKKDGLAKQPANGDLKRCFYLYFTMLLQERFRATYCFGSFDYTFPMQGTDLRQQWNARDHPFYEARRDLRDNRIPRYCQKAYDDGINCVLE